MAMLVQPTERYRGEFLAAERDFAEAGGERLFDRHYWLVNDFVAYLKQVLTDQARQPCERGRVASSWFWLVDGATYLGRVSLRHRLNPRLRRSGGHIGYEIRRRSAAAATVTKRCDLPCSKREALDCAASSLFAVRLTRPPNGLSRLAEASWRE
jgi:predicted acetyltransferase